MVTLLRHRYILRLGTSAALAFLLAACGGGSGGGSAGNPPVAQQSACDATIEHCGPIPDSTNPCTEDQFWPFSEASGQRPFLVHYPRMAYREKALDVIAEIERVWTREVDELGFAAPQRDGGLCGPNALYDIFIWPGLDGAFVDGIAANPDTRRDDYLTYMGINVGAPNSLWLPGPLVAHEFNHAVQASDDWWESTPIYEMTATFVEALVYPERIDYFFTLRNFQARPGWSLFYDDGYETWYMYGASMYLHFLRERYFTDDPAFIARIWRAMRSDPELGRPDYLDAIRAVLLNERGIELDDTMVEFSQWRWFVAEFDDGAHFERGAEWPRPVAFTDADSSMPTIDAKLEAMVYGAQYVRVSNDSDRSRSYAVALQQDQPDVDWRLTSINGDTITALITIPADSAMTIVATLLPDKPISDRTLDFNLRTATLTLVAN